MSTSMSATMCTSMSAAKSSQRFVRSQRRWRNGNPKLLWTDDDGRTDRLTGVLETLDKSHFSRLFTFSLVNLLLFGWKTLLGCFEVWRRLLFLNYFLILIAAADWGFSISSIATQWAARERDAWWWYSELFLNPNQTSNLSNAYMSVSLTLSGISLICAIAEIPLLRSTPPKAPTLSLRLRVASKFEGTSAVWGGVRSRGVL